MLSHVGPEFHLSGKQHFGCENEQEAYRRGTEYLYEKQPERPKLKPFQENQVAVVKQHQHKHINAVRRPAHGFGGGFTVVELGAIAGGQYIDQEGAGIGNQYTGSGMKSGRGGEVVKRQPGNKSKHQQPDTG